MKRSNIADKAKTDIIATNPPATAEKKKFKKFWQMFEIKCPNKLQGIIIKQYFDIVEVKLRDRSPISDLIFLMFKKLINDIDKKKEIIMLWIPTSGVKIIKQANRRAEPSK